MRIRYTGPDESRDIAMPGGVIRCPRMEWVDIDAQAAEGGIRLEHAHIVARSIVSQDDWQSEGHVKAARTRKANQATDDKEQS